MSDTKTSAGLVPEPVDLSGLTEIRVHGVGGSGPDELLGDVSPKRVSGDNTAGFYRTADALGRHREAYSWGGLTSRSRLRVLWILLLPSMLANMAGWMARRRVATGEQEAAQEPTTRWFRWWARLAALGLTLSTALMVTMLSFDIFAYQCLGQSSCRNQLWAPQAWDFLAPYDRPAQRLAAGIMAPVVVALLFFVLASISRASFEGYEYEHIEPLAEGETYTPPSNRCAAAQAGGLRSADFWFGRHWHKHLSYLHLAAGFAVVTGMLGWCVSNLPGAIGLPAAGVLAWFALAASSVLMIVVIVILKTDKATVPLAATTLIASVVVLAATTVAACLLPIQITPESEPVAQSPGVSPGIMVSVRIGWIIVILLLLPLIGQQTLAWVSRRVHAWKDAPPGTEFVKRLKGTPDGIKVFPWAAPVVLNVVALVLGNAALLSLMMLTARGLGRVEYAGSAGSGAEPAGGAGVRPVLWVPEGVASVTSILTLGLLAVLILFAVVAAAWLGVKSIKDAPRVMRDLQNEYNKAKSPQTHSVATTPASQKRQKWNTSAFTQSRPPLLRWITSVFEGSRPSPLRADPTDTSNSGHPGPWVLKVALMRLIGGYSRTLAACLMIAIAVLVGLGTVLFLSLSWVLNQDLPTLPEFWVELGTTVIGAWLPILYLVAAQVAFRNDRWRKALMTPFDVGTFFPRSFHPFAPPSYAERAVPELTRRILYLHDHNGRVVLTAHSQGSIIAAAVLVRESARTEKEELGLVTLGSPLGKLYRWAFPALLSDGLLQSIALGNVGIGKVSWRNVYYATDYIGGPAALEEWSAPKEADIPLVDPDTDKFIFGQPPPHILTHTGYWVDPRFWKVVDDMCVKIAPRLATVPPADISPTPALADAGFVSGNGSGAQEGSMEIIAPDPTAPPRYR